MFKTTYRKKYDYIIIESGPSAFASLYAFSKQKIKLGNFFNNWLAIIYSLPIGFYLHSICGNNRKDID
jgi:hypothetical protein